MVDIQGIDGFVDPINTANYRLDCGDQNESLVIGFTSFTGPEVSRDALDYYPGGTTGYFVRKVPTGLVKVSAFTVKKAIVPIDQLDNLRKWWEQVCDAKAKGVQARSFRRSCKMYALDNQGVVQKTVTLVNCWPTRFKPLSDGEGVNPAIAECELEIVCEGLITDGALGLSLPFSSAV